MSTLKTMPQGRLYWGARAIAEVLFGPEDAKSQWHKVYSLKHELPIFSMTVASERRVTQSVDHRSGLAARPQRFHPSGSRFSRRGREQEPQRCAHLFAARR